MDRMDRIRKGKEGEPGFGHRLAQKAQTGEGKKRGAGESIECEVGGEKSAI